MEVRAAPSADPPLTHPKAPPVVPVVPVAPAPAVPVADPNNSEEKRAARLARFGPSLIPVPPPRHKGPAVPERREEVKAAAVKEGGHGGHKHDKGAEARKAQVAELCSDADLAARSARWGKFAPSVAKTWLNTPLDLDLLAVKYKEERVDVPATASLRRNVLHVYGTDGLDAEPFAAHFAAFAPVELEWINDSSCNVVLSSDGVAENALHMLTVPPKMAPGVEMHPNVWRLGNTKCGANVLLMRYATPADRKPKKAMSQALAPQGKIQKPRKVLSKNTKRALAAGGLVVTPAVVPQEQLPSVPESTMTEAAPAAVAPAANT